MRAAAIIVNYNGGEDLSRCLDSLRVQTAPVEVVLVDCASTDGTRSVAEEPPVGVRGVALATNAGYAGGCNAGLAVLSPEVEVVAFFNPDCFAAPDLFERCLEVLRERPEAGGVAPRLVRPGGMHLDSCGQVLTPLLLRVRDRGYSEPAAGAYEEAADVLAACGAGMVYRRAALEAMAVDGEVFPGSFFAFWEDLDLGWRVCAAGWRIRYEPTAVAVHRRAATAGAGKGRLVFRRSPALAACIVVNRWATLVRNLHTVDFLLRLPLLLAGDAMMLALLLTRRPRVAGEVVHALPRLREAWRQRRRIPRRRLGELP